MRKDEIAGALGHVPANILRTPVFNEYGLGDNLIFDGIPPFIDSRAELYGDGFLAQYGQIMRPNREAFLKVASKYEVGWTILSAGSPLADVVENLPGWRRVYADKNVTVDARTAKDP